MVSVDTLASVGARAAFAAKLGKSEITVKARRGEVMRKMKAAPLADLVRMAATLNIPLPRMTAPIDQYHRLMDLRSRP